MLRAGHRTHQPDDHGNDRGSNYRHVRTLGPLDDPEVTAASSAWPPSPPRGAIARGRGLLRLRILGPAVFLLAGALTVGATQLSGDDPADVSRAVSGTIAGAAKAAPPVDLSGRGAALSRALTRTTAQPTARRARLAQRVRSRVVLNPEATGHDYATALLNVWTGPGEKPPRVDLVQSGTRIAVTGRTQGHWAEVLLPRPGGGTGSQTGSQTGGQSGGRVVRWVNADYLSDEKPQPEPEPQAGSEAAGAVPETADSGTTDSGTTDSGTPSGGTATGGISGAPCPDGSATEAGITSGAVRLFRAVCAAFPALTTYGGYDAHGEHADGRAIDFMITDAALGQAVATWAQANAGALGIRDIIWSQHIWTPERSAEGWRYMSDRGSPTANHYDHVHIAVY